MRECNHATCGETCRRPKKERKIYRLQPYAVKRQEENKLYNAEAKEYKINNPVCAIKSPVCIKKTQGVNHKKGRGIYLMDKETWEPACNPCNQYCEDNTQWAINNGHKESRLTI